MDTPALADLLRETEEQHGRYEQSHPAHHWWDWYASYLQARQQGSTPEQAATAAARYVEELRNLTPS